MPICLDSKKSISPQKENQLSITNNDNQVFSGKYKIHNVVSKNDELLKNDFNKNTNRKLADYLLRDLRTTSSMVSKSQTSALSRSGSTESLSDGEFFDALDGLPELAILSESVDLPLASEKIPDDSRIPLKQLLLNKSFYPLISRILQQVSFRLCFRIINIESLYLKLRDIYFSNESTTEKILKLMMLINENPEIVPDAYKNTLSDIFDTLNQLAQFQETELHQDNSSSLSKKIILIESLRKIFSSSMLKNVFNENISSLLTYSMKSLSSGLIISDKINKLSDNSSLEDFIYTAHKQNVIPESIYENIQACQKLINHFRFGSEITKNIILHKPLPRNSGVSEKIIWASETLDFISDNTSLPEFVNTELLNFIHSAADFFKSMNSFPEEGSISQQLMWLQDKIQNPTSNQRSLFSQLSFSKITENAGKSFGIENLPQQISMLYAMTDPSVSVWNKLGKIPSSLLNTGLVSKTVQKGLNYYMPVTNLLYNCWEWYQKLPENLSWAETLQKASNEIIDSFSMNSYLLRSIIPEAVVNTADAISFIKDIPLNGSWHETLSWLADRTHNDSRIKWLYLRYIEICMLKGCYEALSNHDDSLKLKSINTITQKLKNYLDIPDNSSLAILLDIVPWFYMLSNLREKIAALSPNLSWSEWLISLLSIVEKDPDPTVIQLRSYLEDKIITLSADMLTSGIDYVWSALPEDPFHFPVADALPQKPAQLAYPDEITEENFNNIIDDEKNYSPVEDNNEKNTEITSEYEEKIQKKENELTNELLLIMSDIDNKRKVHVASNQFSTNSYLAVSSLSAWWLATMFMAWRINFSAKNQNIEKKTNMKENEFLLMYKPELTRKVENNPNTELLIEAQSSVEETKDSSLLYRNRIPIIMSLFGSAATVYALSKAFSHESISLPDAFLEFLSEYYDEKEINKNTPVARIKRDIQPEDDRFSMRRLLHYWSVESQGNMNALLPEADKLDNTKPVEMLSAFFFIVVSDLSARMADSPGKADYYDAIINNIYTLLMIWKYLGNHFDQNENLKTKFDKTKEKNEIKNFIETKLISGMDHCAFSESITKIFSEIISLRDLFSLSSDKVLEFERYFNLKKDIIPKNFFGRFIDDEYVKTSRNFNLEVIEEIEKKHPDMLINNDLTVNALISRKQLIYDYIIKTVKWDESVYNDMYDYINKPDTNIRKIYGHTEQVFDMFDFIMQSVKYSDKKTDVTKSEFYGKIPGEFITKYYERTISDAIDLKSPVPAGHGLEKYTNSLLIFIHREQKALIEEIKKHQRAFLANFTDIEKVNIDLLKFYIISDRIQKLDYYERKIEEIETLTSDTNDSTKISDAIDSVTLENFNIERLVDEFKHQAVVALLAGSYPSTLESKEKNIVFFNDIISKNTIEVSSLLKNKLNYFIYLRIYQTYFYLTSHPNDERIKNPKDFLTQYIKDENFSDTNYDYYLEQIKFALIRRLTSLPYTQEPSGYNTLRSLPVKHHTMTDQQYYNIYNEYIDHGCKAEANESALHKVSAYELILEKPELLFSQPKEVRKFIISFKDFVFDSDPNLSKLYKKDEFRIKRNPDIKFNLSLITYPDTSMYLISEFGSYELTEIDIATERKLKSMDTKKNGLNTQSNEILNFLGYDNDAVKKIFRKADGYITYASVSGPSLRKSSLKPDKEKVDQLNKASRVQFTVEEKTNDIDTMFNVLRKSYAENFKKLATFQKDNSIYKSVIEEYILESIPFFQVTKKTILDRNYKATVDDMIWDIASVLTTLTISLAKVGFRSIRSLKSILDKSYDTVKIASPEKRGTDLLNAILKDSKPLIIKEIPSAEKIFSSLINFTDNAMNPLPIIYILPLLPVGWRVFKEKFSGYIFRAASPSAKKMLLSNLDELNLPLGTKSFYDSFEFIDKIKVDELKQVRKIISDDISPLQITPKAPYSLQDVKNHTTMISASLLNKNYDAKVIAVIGLDRNDLRENIVHYAILAERKTKLNIYNDAVIVDVNIKKFLNENVVDEHIMPWEEWCENLTSSEKFKDKLILTKEFSYIKDAEKEFEMKSFDSWYESSFMQDKQVKILHFPQFFYDDIVETINFDRKTLSTTRGLIALENSENDLLIARTKLSKLNNEYDGHLIKNTDIPSSLIKEIDETIIDISNLEKLNKLNDRVNKYALLNKKISEVIERSDVPLYLQSSLSATLGAKIYFSGIAVKHYDDFFKNAIYNDNGIFLYKGGYFLVIEDKIVSVHSYNSSSLTARIELSLGEEVKIQYKKYRWEITDNEVPMFDTSMAVVQGLSTAVTTALKWQTIKKTKPVIIAGQPVSDVNPVSKIEITETPAGDSLINLIRTVTDSYGDFSPPGSFDFTPEGGIKEKTGYKTYIDNKGNEYFYIRNKYYKLKKEGQSIKLTLQNYYDFNVYSKNGVWDTNSRISSLSSELKYLIRQTSCPCCERANSNQTEDMKIIQAISPETDGVVTGTDGKLYLNVAGEKYALKINKDPSYTNGEVTMPDQSVVSIRKWGEMGVWRKRGYVPTLSTIIYENSASTNTKVTDVNSVSKIEITETPVSDSIINLIRTLVDSYGDFTLPRSFDFTPEGGIKQKLAHNIYIDQKGNEYFYIRNKYYKLKKQNQTINLLFWNFSMCNVYCKNGIWDTDYRISALSLELKYFIKRKACPSCKREDSNPLEDRDIVALTSPDTDGVVTDTDGKLYLSVAGEKYALKINKHTRYTDGEVTMPDQSVISIRSWGEMGVWHKRGFVPELTNIFYKTDRHN
ncbi:hypothetical protein ABW286_10680 [Erwinia papayae]|uniref:Uncharacterized protein n=1 Tax=Erwinia papayae TaxID=206499 RepID=A0ABV3N1J3_9GAMM